MTDILSPLTLGRTTLSNRLVVAPMTTSQSQNDGQVSVAEAAWLERLASDAYGMVITCAAAVSKTSIAFARQMSLADDSLLPGLTALASRLNRYPTLNVVQLCHGGSRAIAALTGVEPHSASAYELPGVAGFVRPKAFSIPQIEQVVEDFAQAAARAATAGFGGVEFHGANGYLFTQFISKMTNQRHDDYGGSLENRARFSREVVRAVRRRVPANFVIGFRMSFEGFGPETGLDIDENIAIMNWLAQDGIDYGHLSNMALQSKSTKYPQKTALEVVRAGVDAKLPLVAAGGVVSYADAQRALDLGASMVAVARAAIGNAKIPARFANREALTPMPFVRAQLAPLAVSQQLMDYIGNSPLASLGILGPAA